MIIHRIRRRMLYRMVGLKVFSWERRATCKECITPASIVRAAKGLSSQFAGDLLESLTEADVIVDVADITYGGAIKDKNPVDFVKFYSKYNPNRECPSFDWPPIDPSPIFTL